MKFHTGSGGSSGGGGGGNTSNVGGGPGGRLTLLSNTPIPTTDQLLKTVVFYTPYVNNLIRVFNGTSWNWITFSQLSFDTTGLLAANSFYDWFVTPTPSLELSAAWANASTRTDALATQDGTTVKASDHTRLWVGSMGTNAAGTTSDAESYRALYNAYNQVIRRGKLEDTNGHTYSSSTPRYWNNNSSNVLSVMLGAPQSVLLTLAADF